MDSIGTMDSMGTTTISLKEETKERLRQRGEKGESYDDIIRRLLDEAPWRPPEGHGMDREKLKRFMGSWQGDPGITSEDIDEVLYGGEDEP